MSLAGQRPWWPWVLLVFERKNTRSLGLSKTYTITSITINQYRLGLSKTCTITMNQLWIICKLQPIVEFKFLGPGFWSTWAGDGRDHRQQWWWDDHLVWLANFHPYTGILNTIFLWISAQFLAFMMFHDSFWGCKRHSWSNLPMVGQIPVLDGEKSPFWLVKSPFLLVKTNLCEIKSSCWLDEIHHFWW